MSKRDEIVSATYTCSRLEFVAKAAIRFAAAEIASEGTEGWGAEARVKWAIDQAEVFWSALCGRFPEPPADPEAF